MKIAYLTAGAAGMYCGSCMLDNALAKAMIQQGHECLLVPLYTPIRTDEEDVSIDQVFFGGINVYLQQRLPFLKWLPRWLDAPLNNANLVRRLTKNTGKVSMDLLGKMTVSMLAGLEGNQQKEASRLCDWISRDIQPDVVLFSNLMIAGVLPELRRRLKAKLWVIFQGDDIFLESLPEKYRNASIDRMNKLDQFVDGYISHSKYYASHMSQLLSVPETKINVVPLGIDTTEFRASQRPHKTLESGPKIGYFARLSKEKGLHRLVDAFIAIANTLQMKSTTLHIAGYLGPQNIEFWELQQKKIAEAGLTARVVYHGSIDRQAKIDFLQSIDLLCMPTEYREPKGLFVLEAVAAGAPYLLPNHGAFGELHERLGYGWLFQANNAMDLQDTLQSICDQDGRMLRELKSPFPDQQSLLQEVDVRLMAERKIAILKTAG